MNTTELNTIYRKHFNHLKNYAISKTNIETGLDITQNAFVKFFENIENYPKATIENSIYILFKIANNLIIDQYRKVKLNAISIDEINEKGESIEIPEKINTEPTNSELRKVYREVLKEFSPKVRKIFTLHILQNYKTIEIAQMLNVKHSTIRKLVYDNKEKIAKKVRAKIIN